MMDESLETFRALDPVGYVSKFVLSNTRPDCRPHHCTRPTHIQPSILTKNSYGSSLITLGNTKVITGIALRVGTPSISAPTKGEIDVSVMFSPICGGQYNVSGKIIHDEYEMRSAAANAYADPQSIESFVKRTIINSNMIDLNQLCILEGKAAWKIEISCTAINHDGNIVDAFLLGAVVALMDLELPRVKLEKVEGQEVVRLIDDTTKILRGEENTVIGKKLKFEKMCIPLTVGLFQEKLLVDPSLEEELLCDGMMTVVVDCMSVKKLNGVLTGDVLGISKSGGSALISMEEIAACVQLSFGRAKELSTILETL